MCQYTPLVVEGSSDAIVVSATLLRSPVAAPGQHLLCLSSEWHLTELGSEAEASASPRHTHMPRPASQPRGETPLDRLVSPPSHLLEHNRVEWFHATNCWSPDRSERALLHLP